MKRSGEIVKGQLKSIGRNGQHTNPQQRSVGWTGNSTGDGLPRREEI